NLRKILCEFIIFPTEEKEEEKEKEKEKEEEEEIKVFEDSVEEIAEYSISFKSPSVSTENNNNNQNENVNELTGKVRLTFTSDRDRIENEPENKELKALILLEKIAKINVVILDFIRKGIVPRAIHFQE